MTDFIPNSYQTPNDYVDQFMHLLTSDEWKVLTYTVRRIFGFQKRQDRISLTQYEQGARDRNGNPLDHGTGLSRPTIIKALATLEQFGLQVLIEPNNRQMNEAACYTLQLSAGKVDVAGLERRAAESKRRGRERTESARETTPRHTRGAGKSDLPALSDTGMSDLPAKPVSGTYRPRSMPLTTPGKSDIPGVVSGTYTQYTGEIQEEIQEKHTHTAAAPSETPANGRGHPAEKPVCECKTPHGSEFCDEVRIAYARNQQSVHNPHGYAMTKDARAGVYDGAVREFVAKVENPAEPKRPRDTSACPDCHGKGFWYPAGEDTPEGRARGTAKCKHPRLEAELERLQQEAAASKDLLAAGGAR